MYSAKVFKDADGWAGRVAKGKPYAVPVPANAKSVRNLGTFATRAKAMAEVTATIWELQAADEFPRFAPEGAEW